MCDPAAGFRALSFLPPSLPPDHSYYSPLAVASLDAGCGQRPLFRTPPLIMPLNFDYQLFSYSYSHTRYVLVYTRIWFSFFFFTFFLGFSRSFSCERSRTTWKYVHTLRVYWKRYLVARVRFRFIFSPLYIYIYIYINTFYLYIRVYSCGWVWLKRKNSPHEWLEAARWPGKMKFGRDSNRTMYCTCIAMLGFGVSILLASPSPLPTAAGRGRKRRWRRRGAEPTGLRVLFLYLHTST